MGRVVLKFGGTSVASLARWQTIADVARARLDAGRAPVVVCSAVSGVSDQLIALVDACRRGEHEALLAAIVARHQALADALDVPLDVVRDDLDHLRRLATGAALLGEAGPAVHARIVARGELLSTRLGAAWMEARGLPVRWVDARDLLTSDAPADDPRTFLSAHVPFGPDPRLEDQLGEGIVLTQGFIARDPRGRTVLLGRGGSDTSAALLAGRLRAPCEIWTDVPGMFTADPRSVPSARLIRRLDYAEAQEIATMGAKVLHPRCLAPVREARVPMSVRCTQRPELEGTTISATPASKEPQVKAISARKGLVLVTMETLGMWQEVGFLARAFAVFAAHDLSVDTVSTSETSVTVTLDPSANSLDPQAVRALLGDLRAICTPSVVEGCASVSLVGRGIRAILHRLAPVLELFEEHRVHLVSQAANDLNLTVVVDEEQAPRLIERLHALLFAHRSADEVLGPTWGELFAERRPRPTKVATGAWWVERRDELLAIGAGPGPAYVMHEATLRARCRALKGLEAIDQIFYAMKANSHPDVLGVVASEGLGFETVSPGELARVRRAFPTAPTLFTPNFAPRQEYAEALADPGVRVTLDNLHPLEKWPELFAGRDLVVRMDPGKGRGHHAKVRTAGAGSKFGVSVEQLPVVVEAADAAGARIVGLHAHAGSGVLEARAWVDVALFLATLAEDLPHVVSLDLGGGLGVPAHPGQDALDLGALDASLRAVREAHPRFQLQLEPGRFVVAEAGVLLAKVTQLKRKGSLHYVGVEAGMHTLIRPALYGARHHVVNLTRLDQPAGPAVTVVGPICETGDVLARDRHLPPCEEGDVLLFATAGAYGAAMSSDYNLRPRAREILLGP